MPESQFHKKMSLGMVLALQPILGWWCVRDEDESLEVVGGIKEKLYF